MSQVKVDRGVPAKPYLYIISTHWCLLPQNAELGAVQQCGKMMLQDGTPGGGRACARKI